MYIPLEETGEVNEWRRPTGSVKLSRQVLTQHAESITQLQLEGLEKKNQEGPCDLQLE